MITQMETQILKIPDVHLHWSDWHPWWKIVMHARASSVHIPSKQPGVYEVRLLEGDERLTIGMTTDLRYRIRQCLVKGKGKHSAGERIRATVDTSMIEVRWAETDRPAAAEEELHRHYLEKHGQLPRYTEH